MMVSICYAVSLTVLFTLIPEEVAASSRVKCLKDKDLGSQYPANVYYCDNPKKPVCCEEDNDFKCCEEKDKKILREQLQLWGALGLVVIVVAVVVICWRKDTYLCEGATMKERCATCCRSCCRRKNKEDVGVIRIKVSKKYRKAPDEPEFDKSRSQTTIGVGNVDPKIAGTEVPHSDIDSGRGSVASTSTSHTDRLRDDGGLDHRPRMTTNEVFQELDEGKHSGGHFGQYGQALETVQAYGNTEDENSRRTRRRKTTANSNNDSLHDKSTNKFGVYDEVSNSHDNHEAIEMKQSMLEDQADNQGIESKRRHKKKKKQQKKAEEPQEKDEPSKRHRKKRKAKKTEESKDNENNREEYV